MFQPLEPRKKFFCEHWWTWQCGTHFVSYSVIWCAHDPCISDLFQGFLLKHTEGAGVNVDITISAEQSISVYSDTHDARHLIWVPFWYQRRRCH